MAEILSPPIFEGASLAEAERDLEARKSQERDAAALAVSTGDNLERARETLARLKATRTVALRGESLATARELGTIDRKIAAAELEVEVATAAAERAQRAAAAARIGRERGTARIESIRSRITQMQRALPIQRAHLTRVQANKSRALLDVEAYTRAEARELAALEALESELLRLRDEVSLGGVTLQ